MAGSSPDGLKPGEALQEGACNVHATAIAVGGLGMLLRGPARSGKSALCLSLLRRAPGLGLEALLVADDRVWLSRAADGELIAAAPPALAGLLEISGIGIMRMPHLPQARIGLIADLAPPAGLERLPPRRAERLLGCQIPAFALPEREAGLGADILLTLALQSRAGDGPEFGLAPVEGD